MKNKILIFGFGKMGRIHGKYCEQLRLDWSYYDKYESKHLPEKKIESISDINEFTHLILATPTSLHEDQLQDLIESFDGKILVEKPGVMSLEKIGLLKNDRVSVGMVERFNPAIQTLSRSIDREKLFNIDFIRCSAKPVSRIEVNSFIDVGIHDIDLFCTLFPNASIDRIDKQKTNNTFFLNISFDKNKVARFIWSNETFHKERRIYARQTNCNFECDLAEQIVQKYSVESVNNRNVVENLYVEKKSPILCEVENFVFGDERVDAVDSHEIFIKILEEDGSFRE